MLCGSILCSYRIEIESILISFFSYSKDGESYSQYFLIWESEVNCLAECGFFCCFFFFLLFKLINIPNAVPQNQSYPHRVLSPFPLSFLIWECGPPSGYLIGSGIWAGYLAYPLKKPFQFKENSLAVAAQIEGHSVRYPFSLSLRTLNSSSLRGN